MTSICPRSLADVPLKVHARYQREEILAALDFPRNPNSFREGVWYSQDLNVDAFFVTLKKSEADYSPTTMYRDYPIQPDALPLGVAVHDLSRLTDRARYLSAARARSDLCQDQQKDEFGTSPYLFLGPAHYVRHTGDRPIAITWRLDHAHADGLLYGCLRRRTVTRRS